MMGLSVCRLEKISQDSNPGTKVHSVEPDLMVKQEELNEMPHMQQRALVEDQVKNVLKTMMVVAVAVAVAAVVVAVAVAAAVDVDVVK